MKPIHTVGVLIFKNDRVLLVRHEQNAEHESFVYGLPAGRINEGEGDRDAAVRELFEETGLSFTSESLRELPKIYTAEIKRKDGTIKTFSLKVFVADSFSGELKASSETIPEWVPIKDIGLLKMLPNVEEIIRASIIL